MGLDEFLQVLGGFFLRIVAKLLHQRFCWLKFAFLAKINSKQGFDSSTRVFQGFGWCRIYDDIKLWQVLISTVIADQGFIYIFKNLYRIQKFWGHMLQRHSNPTKNKVWWPRQTKLLVGFRLRFLRVFMGLDEFLQVCDGFFFRGLWRSCFIKNLVFVD